MFELYYRPRYEFVKIYAVRDDINGFPHFLILDEGQWKYVSAKHFADGSD